MVVLLTSRSATALSGASAAAGVSSSDTVRWPPLRTIAGVTDDATSAAAASRAGACSIGARVGDRDVAELGFPGLVITATTSARTGAATQEVPARHMFLKMRVGGAAVREPRTARQNFRLAE